MKLLRSLEPVQERSQVTLIYELEDVNEVTFWMQGIYQIGYHFNGEDYFKIFYRNSNVIGAYNVSYNVKSEYIYRTVSQCNGFFVRKKAWHNILKNHDQMAHIFKAKIARDYEIKVSRVLRLHKQLDI